MHSASQSSTGASRHDVSALDRRMKQERVVQQSVMSQLLLLSKPDPKALPDFIEIMVSGGRSFVNLVIPFKSEKEQERLLCSLF